MDVGLSETFENALTDNTVYAIKEGKDHMSSVDSTILTGLVRVLEGIPAMVEPDARINLLSFGFSLVERSGLKASDNMHTDLVNIVNYAANLGKLDALINNAKEYPESRKTQSELGEILSGLKDKQRPKGQTQSPRAGIKASDEFQYDVFISYASEDRPVVEQIIQDFRRAGVTYWVDHEQIDFGDRITEKIEEGLRESKYVVVCLSANLGRSNWVRAEYGSILHKELGRISQGSGRKVIPLKLDDSSDDNIPLLLYNKRRANYSNVTEFNQLLEFLKQRPKFPVSYSEEAAALFDVFLAHNSQDKPLVESIAERLRQRGLNPWLDKEQIPPGRWFQDVIQQAITTVKSAAIFIGPKGLGKWQRIELRTFISQCVEADLPVIPVLLPGVSDIPKDLPFFKELNWVRFSSGIDDPEALDNLEWGITGKHPRKS